MQNTLGYSLVNASTLSSAPLIIATKEGVPWSAIGKIVSSFRESFRGSLGIVADISPKEQECLEKNIYPAISYFFYIELASQYFLRLSTSTVALVTKTNLRDHRGMVDMST